MRRRVRGVGRLAFLLFLALAAGVIWAVPPDGVNPGGGRPENPGPPPGVGGGTLSLALRGVPTSITLANGVFAPTAAVFPVTIQKSGPSVNYFVTVSAGQLGSFEPRRMPAGETSVVPLEYNIYTPSLGIAKDTSVALSSVNVAAGIFQPGDREATASFEVRIPSGQFVTRGTHADLVVISLYQGTISNAANAVLWAQANLTIYATTAAFTEVRIGPPNSLAASSSYTVDFGPLQAQTYREADILYRTNMPFSLSMRSDNGGRLVSVDSGAYVPYRMSVGGSVVGLSTEVTIAAGLFGGTANSYEQVPLQITILDFGLLPPGLYRDAVVVTITTY